MVDKVTKAHKSILTAFEAQRLVYLLMAKLMTFNNNPKWLGGEVKGKPDTAIANSGKELIKLHPDYMKYKWYWRNWIKEDLYSLTKTEEKQLQQFKKQKSKAVARVVEMYPKVATA